MLIDPLKGTRDLALITSSRIKIAIGMLCADKEIKTAETKMGHRM